MTMQVQHEVSFPGLGIEMTVNENVFTIGSFEIKWYGLLIGIGFFLAITYGFKNAKRMRIDEDKLLDAIIWGLIGGVIGARLFYIIFYPGNFFFEDTFMDNFLLLFKIKEGGLGFYGGLIGALAAAGITCKVRKMKIPALFDIVSIGFLIGQAIGRWGNFANQEAFGTPTDLPWGMMSANTGYQPVHPCFFYESILCIIGFIFLNYFNKRLRRYDGQTFILYLVWYGTIRSVIESLRTDSLIIGNTGLRVSMVIGIVTAFAGIILLIVFRKRTALSGCGDPSIMELNGITDAQVDDETNQEAENNKKIQESEQDEIKDRTSEKKRYSTIFGDMEFNEADAVQQASEPEKNEESISGEVNKNHQAGKSKKK